MGVMNNLLHTESARVVSLNSCNHSEGRSGKLPMENALRASQGGQAKYKRRRVFAVRDFPPGCGRLASHINLRSNEEASVGTTSLEAENLVLPSNVDRPNLTSDDPDGTLLPENVSKSLNEVDVGKPKEEMVLESGLKASSQPEGTLLLENMSKNLNEVDVGTLKAEMVLQNSLKASSQPEGTLLPDNVSEISNEVDVGTPKEEMVSQSALNASSQPEGTLLAENVSKSLNAVDVGAPKEQMILHCGLKASSQPDRLNALPNGSRLETIMTGNYPPRRRVSAVRDFPPYCGRNAPPLRNEDSIKALASSGGLDQEKPGTEDKPTKVAQEDTREKSIKSPGETKQYRFDSKSGAVIKSSNVDVGAFEENLVRDMVAYAEEKQVGTSHSDGSVTNCQFQEEDSEVLVLAEDLVIVHGLIAAQNCPWRLGKGAHKASSGSGTGKSQRKKLPKSLLSKSTIKTMSEAEADSPGGPFIKKNSYVTGKAYQGLDQLVIKNEENSLGHGGEHENSQVGGRPRIFEVSVPPSRPSGKGLENGDTSIRNKVKDTLRHFQTVYRKLLQEEEAKSSKERNSGGKRVDMKAYTVLKETGLYVNVGKKVIGSVPGVEVGDEFHFRVELNIIGLHSPFQGGIDWVKHNGTIICTSIVSSEGYDDDLDNPDVLIYTGQGGNPMPGKKEPEDQKLERGNLALANSKDEKNPVRVIRGETRASSDSAKTYIYDGLYLVEKWWQAPGPHGKLVFKYRLIRMPGQPELAWKAVRKCKKFKVREGLCAEDISQGKESIPICAVNTIDDEKPPPFEYITSLIYPDWCHPTPQMGCGCTKGCLESNKCSCVAMNGGEIPYNHDGAIVEVKSLVYECGPACRCPPSCYNRVSQKGIKFQLEIFKTESRGWGVRSLNSIPSGSFICEYVGELLDDEEAEKRKGSDEYLFDIGNNYNDSSLWGGVSKLIPEAQSTSGEVVEGNGFTIDAAEYGNVGRFINHSCSPNLYAQNVLYDHEDKRIPHIMLFAGDNIPPLQELTYHYNYVVDQVFDSDGNIKKKNCYCGSSECTGRLY